MEISWTGHVTNEQVLQTVTEKRNILEKMKIKKAKWMGHILHRNYRPKHVIEGKIEGMIEMT
jgi:hypothetical protein